MGAFSGGATFRRYAVQGDLPKDFKDLFQKGISAHVFRGIDPVGDEERALGWADVELPLNTELTPDRYRFDEYLVLALRVDTLTVPGAMLKLYTEAECRRMMQEQNRESLNRYERAEVKERVKAELRRKMIPTIKAVDMVWNLTEGVVRFYSSNEKVNLEFMELFEASFELLLIPDSPYTVALYGPETLSQEARDALDEVEPSVFVDADIMAAAMTEV